MDFIKLTTEVEELIDFLTSSHWPYHQETNPDAQSIQKRYDNGFYTENNETFFIKKNDQTIGLLIIFDVEDSIVLFDLRLLPSEQGKGYGVEILKWLQTYLFSQPKKHRIEGYTRSDNIAMRKCFVKSGFVKEGYLRFSWENEDGSLADTIIFGSIKKDWQNNCITPIQLEDNLY